MEILQLDGYTEHEKIATAQAYLAPRQIRANSLRPSDTTFTDAAIRTMVQDYIRAASVRNIERQIGTICRTIAVQIAAHGVDRSS